MSPRPSVGLQIPPASRSSGFELHQSQPVQGSEGQVLDYEPISRATGATPSPTAEDQRVTSPSSLKRRSTGSRTLRPEDIRLDHYSDNYNNQDPFAASPTSKHAPKASTSSSADLGVPGKHWLDTKAVSEEAEEDHTEAQNARYPPLPPSSSFRPEFRARDYSLDDVSLSAQYKETLVGDAPGSSSWQLAPDPMDVQPRVSYTPPYKQHPRFSSQHRQSRQSASSSSALGRTPSLLHTASQALRRASLRVVNLGGQDPEAISVAEARQSDLLQEQQQQQDQPHPHPPSRGGYHEKEQDVESEAGFHQDSPISPPEERSASLQDLTTSAMYANAGGSLSYQQQQHPDESRQQSQAPPPQPPPQALVGKTLKLFGPTHPVRRMARKLMLQPWMEPLILVLIIINVIVLTIQAAPSVYAHPRPSSPGYFHNWPDYVLFALMLLFTFEVFLRIVVAGFIFSPYDQWWVGKSASSSRRSGPAASPPNEKRSSSFFQSFSPYGSTSSSHHSESRPEYPHQPLGRTRTDLSMHPKPQGSILTEVPFKLAVDHLQQITVSQKAYLRHSYNRLDFVAVITFWITFVLAMAGAEHRHWLYFFRGLSVLRATRLLTFTTGSLIILHSLKRAGPSLVRVAFFLLFALVLFSVVGIQSFAGSYRRSCVWLDPEGLSNFSTGQVCGSWFDGSGDRQVFLESDLTSAKGVDFKGFTCPQGQICITEDNPSVGISFDNIFTAAFQILVITSANGWRDPMYDMMSAETFWSCLFFIGSLIIMNYWLINMFVAVITFTFDAIVRETRHSAFSAHAPPQLKRDESANGRTGSFQRSRNFLDAFMRKSHYFWVALVVADTAVQASRTNDMSDAHADALRISALVFTVLFDVEILLRLASALPDWKAFFRSPRNRLDAFLALVTTILRIPPVTSSIAYPWLSVFERMRFYRVSLAIPRTHRLLARLGESLNGIANMVLFLLMMVFVASLISVQFLRGEIPEEIDGDDVSYSWHQIYNGYLGLYQVLTSEDWTSRVFDATDTAANPFNVGLNFIFFAAWFLFANSIIVQMFIAVINEGFDLRTDEKLRQQEERFKNARKPKEPFLTKALNKLNFYRKLKPTPVTSVAHIVPSLAVNASRQAVVESYVSSKSEIARAVNVSANDGFTASIRRLNPAGMLRRKRSVRTPEQPASSEEWLDVDHHLALLLPNQKPEFDEELDRAKERRLAEVDFIMSHPTYDKSLWLFTQQSRIRQFCQTLCTPPHGIRVFGNLPHPKRVTCFQLAIFVSVVASVVIAAVATPLYRQSYFIDHGDLRGTWFNISEAALSFFFVMEFFVKVTADGFMWTPNAYLFSIWNVIDFVVLVTILVNVVSAIVFGGAAPTGIRALKALRALRLVNLSPRTRQTFYDVLINGASKLIDASLLAVLYIIPYTVWGQTLFSGLLFSCNDGDVANKVQCVGEYVAEPVNWEFLAPRAWQNPHVWSFDSFRQAFLILFELVSLEGWIDVQMSTSNIVGRNLQPSTNASQFNAIFLLIYMLLGGLFIFALFTSIIIQNFRIRSGMALLTAEQRRWIDIQKLLLQQKPSRRPRFRPTDVFSSWCYDRTVQKNGWWAKTVTAICILHILLLMTQGHGQPSQLEEGRDLAFLAFTFVFAADIIIRMFGLGLKMFRLSWWNIYDLIAVVGAFATTIPAITGSAKQIETQLQKLFLVALSFNLVQKSEALNQLFKTAISSLPAIVNILALWLILFLVYGIADLEVFSLTRWMANEHYNANFGDMLTTLVMLGFMSNGEGWNGFMHDHTVDYPLCTRSNNFLFSDCGNPPWALFLFITWNIISMYIFANMFIGVVVENFSYVFKLKGRVRNVNREDLRSFKRAWQSSDPHRTGYIRRAQFAPFFAKLSGIFDVRIYPEDARLKSILSASRVKGVDADHLYDDRDFTPGVVMGVDLHLLNSRLQTLDFQEVAKRRAVYNRLYHEALLLAETGKGLSFTKTLVLLGHYKLLDSHDCLLFEKRVQREEQLAKIRDLIGLDKVRSLLTTIHYRREFLRYRQLRQREKERGVPFIRVDTSLAPTDSDVPLSAVMRSPKSSISLSRNSRSSSQPPSSPTGRQSPSSPGSPTRSRSATHSVHSSPTLSSRPSSPSLPPSRP